MDLLLNTMKKSPASPFIKEATMETFERDVIAACMTLPVVVDFWAPWCNPCRQMMPTMEKLVMEANGSVLLVKINIEQCPELAQAMQVQSVPTVYAFYQGHPVDGFVGARTEADLKKFFAKLTALVAASNPTEAPVAGEDAPPALPKELIDKLMGEGDTHFSNGDWEKALEAYGAISSAMPQHTESLAKIGWCLLGMNEAAAVWEMLEDLTEAQKNAGDFKGLEWFHARRNILPAATKDGIALALSHDAKDHTARYQLAELCLAEGNTAGAIEALLDITRRNKEWEEQKARKLLLDIFDALGPKHPATLKGRRQLSSLLFS